MKSYLSLIPISARVRRRQNRLTILCIVTAVFLVTAIFSVADMMLCTQTGRAAGKSGSWHLEVTGITPEQAAQLVGQPVRNSGRTASSIRNRMFSLERAVQERFPTES